MSGSADEADCYGRGCARSLDDGAACWIETYAIIEGPWRAEWRDLSNDCVPILECGGLAVFTCDPEG